MIFGIISTKKGLGVSLLIMSSTCNRNVMLALKCMANLQLGALQLYDRYSKDLWNILFNVEILGEKIH